MKRVLWLSPVIELRRNAISRGLLGRSRGWMAVGAFIFGRELLKRTLGKRPELLTTEKLRSGQSLRIDTFTPNTRRSRAARRAR